MLEKIQFTPLDPQNSSSQVVDEGYIRSNNNPVSRIVNLTGFTDEVDASNVSAKSSLAKPRPLAEDGLAQGYSETKPGIIEPVSQEIANLFARGAHFGHQKSYVHPSMMPYIVGVRNNVHIIDVQQTLDKLEVARNFLSTQATQGKIILFVGTKLPVRGLVKKYAEEAGMPYIIERWAGGILTNWKTISLRVEYYRDLEAKTKSEDWEKYPKIERLHMEEELGRLARDWGGIHDMKKQPDVVVVVDMHSDSLAVAEANKLDIPVVAIADTNINVNLATYPIPASDDSLASVEFILEKLAEAITKGKSKVSQ
ncbi:MAG: 30S ribosomal protein S2 [Candidatus Spechtbacteria bacterium]|nr:30S ribosomal protein S2 [Candidatus Spechtbacteria bacterium]